MTGRGGGTEARAVPVLFLLFLGAVAVAVAALAKLRFARYRIEGGSMSPVLAAGDCVIVDRLAYRDRLPRRGHVVLARDPREPARRLVKRVARVDLHGGAWLLGANPAESTDSRTFGSVGREDILGRVRWRYWPPGNPFGVR